MDIINLPFEENILIHYRGQLVTLTAFKTFEPGNVKIGIKAPPALNVDREEIHLQKQNKTKKIPAK